MINAGTVGAYLTLDISDFHNNLITAGQQLEHFKSEQTAGFHSYDGLGSILLGGLTSQLIAASNATADFAAHFANYLGIIRQDAELTGHVVGGLSGAVDIAGSALTRLPDQTRSSVVSACAGMQNAFEAAYPSLYAAARNNGAGFVNAIDGVLNASSYSGGLFGVGIRAMTGLKNGMESGRGAAVSTMTGIMRAMLSAAGSVDFSGVGRGIAGGIATGLNQKKAGLLATAQSIASGISRSIKAALKINSPSRVMMEVGRFTTEGMELGLKQGSRSLYDTASAISDEAAASLSGISSRGLHFSETYATGYGDQLDRLLDAVEKLADSQTTMEIDGRPFGRLVREYV